jgi:phage gpG-like protein
MPVTVFIRGLEKLARAADAADRSKRLLHEGVKKQSEDFMNRVVRTAKSDYLSGGGDDRLKVRTGRLRSSITGTVIENGSDLSIQIGTDVPYAPIHEFGGQAGRGGRVHIRARPFLSRSFADEEDGFISRIEGLLQRVSEGIHAAGE